MKARPDSVEEEQLQQAIKASLKEEWKKCPVGMSFEEFQEALQAQEQHEQRSKPPKKKQKVHEKQVSKPPINPVVRKNFEVVDIAPEGDCQFESIGYFINKNGKVVRKEVVKWIDDKYAKDTRPVKESMNDEVQDILEGKDWQTYVSNMSQLGTWGDSLTLKVAAALYNLRIYLYHPNATNPQVISPLAILEKFEVDKLPKSRVCYMYFHNWQHYDVLEPKPSAVDGAAGGSASVMKCDVVYVSDDAAGEDDVICLGEAPSSASGKCESDDEPVCKNPNRKRKRCVNVVDSDDDN